MTYEAILAALDPTWWFDTFPTDAGTPWPTANIYFEDKAGNYNYYVSTGPVTNDHTSTVEALRQAAARYLVVGQCAGGITDVKPATFQPMPIYFK